MNKEKNTLGIVLTLVAGVLWGFSGACGQYIFENFHTDPSRLTSARLIISGIILCLIGFIFDRKNMVAIWKKKTSVISLLLFAILGLMFTQLSYMKAINYSNSGTATILQYIGPVLVMVVSCFLARRLPSKVEVLAIFMAIVGTFLIATHGNIKTMVLTPLALIWGLLSAFALTFYTMLPVNIIKKYGSMSVTGYGMVIGGIVLSFFTKDFYKFDFHLPAKLYLAFFAIVIFGTVITFSLYLKGVSIIGPVKASMLASIEPVSASLFMVIWLKVPMHPVELVGFLCIFVTIFLLTKKS